jgi:hypothetical protein
LVDEFRRISRFRVLVLFITLDDLKAGTLPCCCVGIAGDSLPLLYGISVDKVIC